MNATLRKAKPAVEILLVSAYVVFSSQDKRQAAVPGSPFPDYQSAHRGLYDYGVLKAGSWTRFLSLIDEYGFIVATKPVVQVPVKP